MSLYICRTALKAHYEDFSSMCIEYCTVHSKSDDCQLSSTGPDVGGGARLQVLNACLSGLIGQGPPAGILRVPSIKSGCPQATMRLHLRSANA